jgi:AcrR family transcriptional regulator
MNLPREDYLPRPGLRERKKAKTRSAIQEHALRLFQEQGYDKTTVEEIADAAEVSPSTFFRYFRTKEDVVMYDPWDPVLIEAFRKHPVEVGPIEALRRAIREVFGNMSQEDRVRQWERGSLIFSVPEIRMRVLDDMIQSMQTFTVALAEWVGRPADDMSVRIFVGAVAGAMLAAMLPAIQDERADFVALMEEGLSYLEAGLPLKPGGSL